MKHEISVIDAARLEPAEFDRMFDEARALGFSIDRMRANLTAQLDQCLFTAFWSPERWPRAPAFTLRRRLRPRQSNGP